MLIIYFSAMFVWSHPCFIIFIYLLYCNKYDIISLYGNNLPENRNSSPFLALFNPNVWNISRAKLRNRKKRWQGSLRLAGFCPALSGSLTRGWRRVPGALSRGRWHRSINISGSIGTLCIYILIFNCFFNLALCLCSISNSNENPFGNGRFSHTRKLYSYNIVRDKTIRW